MKKKIAILLLVVLALTFCAQIYTTANARNLCPPDCQAVYLCNYWGQCHWTCVCPDGYCDF